MNSFILADFSGVSGFLYMVSRHLQIVTALLLPCQFGCLFFFFSPIAVAKTCSSVSNKSGKSRHLSLPADFKGKVQFFPSSMMLAVYFLYIAFIMLRSLSCNPSYLRVFIISRQMLILSNAFSESIEIIFLSCSVDKECSCWLASLRP